MWAFERHHGVTQAEGVRVDHLDEPPTPGREAAAELPDVMSLTTLFRREYPGLVVVAWGLTGSRETAEDIAQEAMLSLHRRWERGDRIDQPAAYVRRACANLAASGVRRRMVEARALLRIGVPQGSTSGLDEGTEVFWAEVRRLPRRQAQAVALFYGYGMSVAELAETLDVSPGTAKTHLHRGRQALAARLDTTADEEVQ